MTAEQIINQFYVKALEGLKDEWLTAETSQWYDYIMALPEKERFTYMIMVMQEQVFNGGFHQYFSNTYGRFVFETISALKQIGAIQHAGLLEQVLQTINKKNDPPKIFREKVAAKNFDSSFNSDEVEDKLEDLVSEYIDLDEDEIFKLLGKYLAS